MESESRPFKYLANNLKLQAKEMFSNASNMQGQMKQKAPPTDGTLSTTYDQAYNSNASSAMPHHLR